MIFIQEKLFWFLLSDFFRFHNEFVNNRELVVHQKKIKTSN